ncbi:hypothetical protein GCM10007416_22930 [Kroppenstedtia guangzhouensis]|uniref:Uncharacterized protein n=1 Tax=Kroppenstedtia guangzhouensis TaxID=1274356 RepID=A0ABQ1GSR1_9BACL|nr:hypothetical protein GCM10007416_22930 [Kroppenstedtia guangzhouensis]
MVSDPEELGYTGVPPELITQGFISYRIIGVKQAGMDALFFIDILYTEYTGGERLCL